ncbi:MAG TPA: hypothetical protein PKC49_05385 [Phycisphaerae bacterium]|nr:hypothetical protein [Phycisphaerae bacterium]
MSILRDRTAAAARRASPALRVGLGMIVAVGLGCDRAAPPHATSNPAGAERAAPTNRLEVPDAVRRNLSISFARVELRHVSRTIRLPGRFELAPHARREYRTMLGGQVELHVTQHERIEAGAPLFTLDSPAWRELQERLSAADAALRQGRARAAAVGPLMAAHNEHEQILRDSVAIWSERVAQLERGGGAGVITAEEFARARSALAASRVELAEVLEKQAELEARHVETEAELAAAHERFELLLMNAASLLGIPKPQLEAPVDPALERHGPHAALEPREDHPLWREILRVDVRAAEPGVVETLALGNGTWAGETSLVLTTVRPERLRFRARGLQSDLGRLRDGLPAAIIPPRGGSLAPSATMAGVIQLGIGGDPDERTVDVFVTPSELAPWARPGITAHLEILLDGDQPPELAVPVAATARDGLRTVLFRRDPRNPDQVIRLEADLGPSDGRWVAIRSGVREGDEVVLDGVFQLMLASSTAAPRGGHFHADGTYHEGPD